MTAAAATDAGRVRPSNEDSVLADLEAGLLIVADGMGGHAAGEVASGLAVKTIAAFLAEALPPGEFETEQACRLLNQAIQWANVAVEARAAEDPALRGMGTTVVLAVCRAEHVVLAHVGDSRAYLIHEGQIRRLTRDHSLVAKMVDAGEITPGEARGHHLRNVITRSLGSGGSSQPDVQTLSWAPGDCLLLCSDGLTNMLEDDEIAGVVAAGGADLPRVCQKLVQSANSRGGTDNISVVVGMNA